MPDPLAPEQARGDWLQTIAWRVVEDALIGDLIIGVVQVQPHWTAIAVAGRGDRAARAEDQTLIERLAVTSMVIHPVPECAVDKRDLAEYRVFAGRLDRFGHGCGPLGVEATRSVGAPPDAARLQQPHLAEGAERVAEVVLENVGVVDTGVERNGAGQFHV